MGTGVDAVACRVTWRRQAKRRGRHSGRQAGVAGPPPQWRAHRPGAVHADAAGGGSAGSSAPHMPLPMPMRAPPGLFFQVARCLHVSLAALRASGSRVLGQVAVVGARHLRGMADMSTCRLTSAARARVLLLRVLAFVFYALQ
jgi:hypothetical protein